MDLSQLPPKDARRLLAAARAYAKAAKVSRKHARATWEARFLGARVRQVRHAGDLTPELRASLVAAYNKAFGVDFKESALTFVRDDALKGGARFLDGDDLVDVSLASLAQRLA